MVAGTVEAETLSAMAALQRTDIEDAETKLRHVLAVNPRHSLALEQLARLYELQSRYATGQKLLLAASKTSPDDGFYLSRYAHTLVSGEEHLAALERAMLLCDPKSKRAGQLRAHIDADRLVGDRSAARLLSPYKSYTLKMPLSGDADVRRFSLKVRLNDRDVNMLLDTGASGIVIHAAAAKKAGIESLALPAIQTGGIGDHPTKATERFYAKEVSVGDLRFGNVLIDVVEGKSIAGEDGLIGSDVFEQFLLTFDFPRFQLKLDPYPGMRSAPEANLLSDAGDQVPPGFQPFRRTGHLLLVPTTVNGHRRRFFLVDSGASSSLLDTEIARQDAAAFRDDNSTVKGVQGRVKDVYRSTNVRLNFAGVVQDNTGLIAIDLTPQSEATGLNIAGIIGFPVLSQVRMIVDYRDGYLKFERAR